MTSPLTAAAPATAARHLQGVLQHALEHTADHAALVVSDARCELARALTEGYRRCLPGATFLDFDTTAPEQVLAQFQRLDAGDLVVLVQSTSFRLDAFRIRIELFRRSLKVIEHPHLERMPGAEGETYIDALAYDQEYYRRVGPALKRLLDRTRLGVLVSAGARLEFPAGFEPAKLNIGDYRELKNVGGQYPIGEVFTESRELAAVQGSVRIAYFGDTQFTVNRPPRPIALHIRGGRVEGTDDSTPEFDRVLAQIRADDGEVRVRELGLGLNRALTLERTVSDIGTFERMLGVHLSLGSKHATYNKPEIRKRRARHHVDVFALTEQVLLDGVEVFAAGAWRV